MLGAIAGDIIGSVYEFNNIKTTEFTLFSTGCRFTDDTVLTVALADTILHKHDYVRKMEDYYFHYPDAGYGGNFHKWATAKIHEPYNSWGNGSAMRVSPVAWAYQDINAVLQKAKESAEVTHNHPEGIKGAQATASAIFFARKGKTKEEIRKFIVNSFGYDLDESLDSIRKYYTFDVSCQGSVPQAIRAFLESESYEDAIRKAVSIGGDSDTIACITGGISEAFYKGVPEPIADTALSILDCRLRDITTEFLSKYCQAVTC